MANKNKVSKHTQYYALKYHSKKNEMIGGIAFITMIVFMVMIVVGIDQAYKENNKPIETKQVTCYDKLGNPIQGVVCTETTEPENGFNYFLIVLGSIGFCIMLVVICIALSESKNYEYKIEDRYTKKEIEKYESELWF